METESKKTVHEIVTGTINDGQLQFVRSVGQAKLYEGNSYYVLKLTMYPAPSYFLVKNKGSLDKYTIYSKVRKAGDEKQFRKEVGYGRLRADLKDYLELQFHLLNRSVFMSLFPKTIVGD